MPFTRSPERINGSRGLKDNFTSFFNVREISPVLDSFIADIENIAKESIPDVTQFQDFVARLAGASLGGSLAYLAVMARHGTFALSNGEVSHSDVIAAMAAAAFGDEVGASYVRQTSEVETNNFYNAVAGLIAGREDYQSISPEHVAYIVGYMLQGQEFAEKAVSNYRATRAAETIAIQNPHPEEGPMVGVLQETYGEQMARAASCAFRDRGREVDM